MAINWRSTCIACDVITVGLFPLGHGVFGYGFTNEPLDDATLDYISGGNENSEPVQHYDLSSSESQSSISGLEMRTVIRVLQTEE